MPVTEKSGLLKYKDKTGNLYIMLPITNTDNVDGLDEMIDEAKIVGTAVAATSTDGVAYTATVPGITALTAGDSFIMIPDKISTSRSTTLNVNNLGAKNLRVRVSGYSGTTSSPMTANWLASNKPVRVTYDGMWWIAEVVLPSAQQLYGNVPAEDVTYSNTNSGMTATDVQEAIDELAGGKTSTQVLTTAEYDALTDKNENVLYMLSDAEDEDSIEANLTIALPINASWNSVCYGNGKFVAVAYNSKVAAYSTNGANWTQTTMPTSANWRSVCYGDGKFVAVAESTNYAAYSTDGVNWTQTTMPASKHWYSVCYGNGKFVAIAHNDAVAYSTDGINWYSYSSLPSNGYWYSVCYGNGKFVALADGKVAAYSTDGIDWTKTTSISTNYDYWRSVCYGNGKFVAVAWGNAATYSTDGITWTRATMPASVNWNSVCYGNGKFVAVAYNSSVAAYSTDGINWTQTTMPASKYWYSVCYGDDGFIAVGGNSSGIAAYSTDGINWSRKKAVRISITEYIDLHNSDSSAHQDIREALEDARIDAANGDNQTLVDAKAYADDAANAIADNILNTVAPAYTYGTSDLTAGTSSLETGKLYFVYE